MKVSFIIPAFNEEKLLPGTLQALQAAAGEAFGRRGWQWEVIVCDNHSSDATAAVAHAGGARVVYEPVNQIGRARNRGASVAQGEWLVFLDADSQPGAGLLAEVAEAMAGGKVAGGGALLAFDRTAGWGRVAVEMWNWVSRLTGWAAGSFLYCRAEAFRELGGFDQELYVSEEIDLSRRLKRWAKRRGLKVKVVSGHRLITSGRKTYLYTLGDHLRFIGQVLYRGASLYRTREHCGIWYDGRR